MERPRRHDRNPNRILHHDRWRHSQSTIRALPRLCSEPSSIQFADGDDKVAEELTAIILSMEPHFIFCLDLDSILKIQTHVPLLWKGKPAPQILDLSSSDLPTRGRVSERLGLALMETLRDPGERRRGFVIPGENGSKSASALFYFLKGTFPWMDVYFHEQSNEGSQEG